MHCKHCGKDSDEPVASTNQQSEAKKTMPLWFKALLGLVALIIGGQLLNVFLTEDLTDTVKHQMTTIRQGQLAEAYDNFSSKKFKAATSFEDFEEFIKKYPAFSENKSIQFKERNVNNDIGILDCVMTTNHDKKMVAEYKLIKESDRWKILSIRLEEMGNSSAYEKENTSKQSTNKFNQSNQINSIKFSQFVLGSSLSPLGLIKNPKNTFKTDSGDIYLNVYVSDAIAGTPIKLIFEHTDSHSTLNPVSTRTASDGEAILSFVFSPPKSSWPKGNYRIKASANETQEFVEFKVD